MQRAHVCAGLGLGFMLAASSTYAGEVQLSVENRIGGDSNVFRAANSRIDDGTPPEVHTAADKIHDGTIDISPTLGVHDDDEDISYGLNYAPTYRNFLKTSGIDGVDHRATARTERRGEIECRYPRLKSEILMRSRSLTLTVDPAPLPFDPKRRISR